MTRRPTTLIVLAVGLVASGACATRMASLDQLPDREYRGHVTTRGGAYWFRPCARPADSLWVTFTGRAVAERDAARTDGAFNEGGRTYVRWKAATGDGRVGPGGPALLVREIMEVRAAASGDCVT